MSHFPPILRRRARTLPDASGFTLIEVVGAMVIFVIVAAALGGLLTSAISATKLARERTIAEQAAQDQIESIRQMPYDSIGTSAGNPSGAIAPTAAINVPGLKATLTTQVSWVNDPTPTSYSAVANYKRVTVTIRNNRNNALLTTAVTNLSPPGRSAFGGLNNATINVKVQDMGLAQNDLVQGALVRLDSGPSSPLSDTTDSNGLVTFPQLTPNPTSGPTAYYDITAAKTGFVTYIDDRVPAPAAHVQVAPSQTLGPQVIRLYMPVQINVQLLAPNGGPYTQAATIKVTSHRVNTTKTYSAPAGSLPITTFANEPVVPGDFTVRAFTPTGLCADPVPHYVPDNYPTTLSTTFTLQLQSCPNGDLSVSVTQLGMPAVGATVEVKDGPNDMSPLTGTTGAGGTVTFTTLPSGSDAYTVTATKGAQTANTSAVVTTGATTPVTIALPDPPMGNRTVNVQWLGSPVNAATVQLSGGPFGITQTLATGPSGSVTFTAPIGSGYTITATKGGQTATATSVSITSSGTTTIAMPTATLTVSATWAGQQIGSGTNNVTVTGGPDGGSYTGSTNSSGVATITVPTSSTSYTVTVTKNGGSGSATVSSVPSGGASVAVAFTQVGTIRVTTTWAGAASSGAAISITGGPLSGTYTGTTDSSGVALVTVPTSTTSYTVSASKSGVIVSGSVPSVATGSTNNISLSFTETFTINVKRNSTNQTTAIVIITGGPTSTTITVTGNNTSGRGQSGNYTMSNVPIGSGYTIKAYANPCSSVSNPKSKTTSSVTIASGQGTINVSYSSSTCPVP